MPTLQQKRPIGVTILAIIFIIESGWSLAHTLGFDVGAPLFLEYWLNVNIDEGGLTVFSIVRGISGIAIGIGMFSGKRWTWYAVIIMVLVSLLMSFTVVRDWMLIMSVILLSVIELLYIRKSNVKAYFGKKYLTS